MNDIQGRSLSFPSSVWLVHVIALLSLSLPGANANLNVTWCLDADKEQLLNLSCGSASLIRINSVIHGWQNVSQRPEPTGCHVSTEDECAEKYPNVKLLLDTCSGLSSCVVSSLELSVLMNSCDGRRSNYVYVEYECVFAGNQTTIVDICGSRLKQGSTPRGYITSPNYPQNYDANTKCSCRLETTVDGEPQRKTEIVLQLLDFDLSPVPNDRSPFDWLQYGRRGRNWGDGHLVGVGRSPLLRADPIFTGSYSVDVDFNTDEQREGRGFWLQYSGLNITSKEEIAVDIECGLYTSPDSRQALSCFEPPRAGELYLSCTAYGVINILKVRAGYRPPANQTSNHLLQECTANDVVARAMCISEVNIPAVESLCMRRTTCNPTAPSSANLTATCGDQPNDFVLIDYQCIADSSQSGNMMDVCGEDMDPGATFVRASGSGFISSPLYPSNYPPDSNCFCQLEVTSSTDAQVVFYVLDLKLSRAPDEELNNSVCSSLASGCSNSDWLEYRSVGQSPDTGRNFSFEGKEEPVYTGSNAVLISFRSDSHMEDRGFWLKYVGRSADGSNSPVLVHCGRSKPQPSATGPHGDVSYRSDETEHNKIGLIVGITVAVIVFVTVLITLVATFLYRRRSRMQTAKLLNESKTNSWNSGKQDLAFAAEESSRSSRSSLKTNRLFARWKRGTSTVTSSIDRPRSQPFALFYNDAYKMQDPTLSHNRNSSVCKKRLSSPPGDFTLHV